MNKKSKPPRQDIIRLESAIVKVEPSRPRPQPIKHKPAPKMMLKVC